MFKTFLAVLFCSFLISFGSTAYAITQKIEVINGVTCIVTYDNDGTILDVTPIGH